MASIWILLQEPTEIAEKEGFNPQKEAGWNTNHPWFGSLEELKNFLMELDQDGITYYAQEWTENRGMDGGWTKDVVKLENWRLERCSPSGARESITFFRGDDLGVVTETILKEIIKESQEKRLLAS
jgi:hypothetical protein